MLKIFNLFDKSQKNYFFILVGLIVVVSILEMVNLAIIIPILNLFLEIENSSKENSFFWFTSFFISGENSLKIFLILFLIFFIFKTFFSIFVSWKHHNFVFNFIENLSFKLYSKYLSFSPSTYSNKNSSELLRNVLKEMDLFYLHLQSLIQIILESIILFGLLIFLVYFLTIPSFLVIIASLVLATIYYSFVKKNLKTWGKDRQAYEEDRIKYMQEGFNSRKEINFFKTHNFFLERFKKQNSNFYKIYINYNFLNSLPRYLFEIFTIILISLIFFFLLLDGKSNEEIIKTLALFFVASFRIIPSFYRIFGSLQNLKYTHASIKTLHSDLKNIKEIPNFSKSPKFKFNEKIELNVESFSHNINSHFKLKNINIDIKKNQKIGLIGKSGSGKSTLLDLFSGVLINDKVQINIDGKKLEKNQIASWQKLIGLIPQNISIINHTFKQNILFGLNEKEFDNEIVSKTVKICNLEKLVSRLPKGLEHNISEKGSNLSGGEIQRIGIARALVFNPEILIFDEATSALDTFTENEILKDINSLPDKTIVMISHRMNTLKFCDKIYLIENGIIADVGNYEKFKDVY